MLKQLTKNIHYLPFGDNDRPTLAAISGSRYTLIVDSGNSPNHATLFLSLLSEYSLSPIRYVVLTHWHWDHSFGLSTMNYISIAHRLTAKKLLELSQLEWNDSTLIERVDDGSEISFVSDMIKQEYPNPQRAISITSPHLAFTNELEIELGELPCYIQHIGGDHSLDSCIVYIPEDNVIFLGDCLYPNSYRYDDYTSKNLFPLINTLLSYDAEYYVDSHAQIMSNNSFKLQCQLLRDVSFLVEKYGDQNPEIILELVNKANSQGITIDKDWLDEINYLISAFQAGFEL